jgi:hypothetical protein
MATIRAPGFEQAVTSPPPITGWSEKKTIAQRQSKNAESCACPQCGMRYRFQDGILYPQSHNKNGVCDACHLEEVIGNITAHEPLHRIINIAITKPSLKKQILIPERKQRFIESVAETLGGFALSRQEIGTVLDLCNDVDISIELEQDARGDNRASEVLTGARQGLVDYISNLGLEKCHDLYSMMLLGRNLDYYGLCQEAVVEFKLRANENVSVTEVVQAMRPERIAQRRDLKNWIQLVLDLVE